MAVNNSSIFFFNREQFAEYRESAENIKKV